MDVDLEQRETLDGLAQLVGEARELASPRSASAWLRNACAEASVRSASGSNWRPAAVRVIPLAPRSKSATLSSSSSALICADNAGWLM